ncbi:ABC transporter ATP-binding protein [Anaerospora sp.]|jgi:iron complex transport system ATP-binding protein|uniref:ABC transporter ATP-binding protein n=1 Tax=Anaerospora sp. TaxID=1960278 RepID=UPI0028989B5A|nr:ABC transporter ATP-binding protein [Anaerospora sp.]
MNILEIQELEVGYPAKTVLSNINLTVSAGQFVSVIAPNGTGKSTLLKAIAGILKPHSGTIFLHGKALTDYSRRELAQQIAVVGSEVTMQEYTALQMVLMGRFPHIPRFSGPSPADHEIVETAMQESGVWDKRFRSCSELSQGERQKIIIARALAQQPRLLLLDEPTAHLDISNQFSILHLIKKLALTKNMAVIAVMHDINLAMQFSTDLLFLKKGQVLAYGSCREVATAENLHQLYDMDFILHRDAAATYVRPNMTE